MYVTAIKISERHGILYETIGHLPEEQTAYERVWMIAGISLAFVIFGTILEAFFFIIYNEIFHPFKNIIIDLRNAEQNVNSISMNDLKTTTSDGIIRKNTANDNTCSE